MWLVFVDKTFFFNLDNISIEIMKMLILKLKTIKAKMPPHKGTDADWIALYSVCTVKTNSNLVIMNQRAADFILFLQYFILCMCEEAFSTSTIVMAENLLAVYRIQTIKTCVFIINIFV